jgi:hypothetical protein
MPLFICRWPNGDFSAVSAPSKEYAIELLDEVDNAELAELFAVKDFMVHFALKQEVQDPYEEVVRLEGFGEATQGVLRNRLYPLVDAALAQVQGTNEEDVKKVNNTLSAERERVKVKETRLSSDPRIAAIQGQTGMPLSKLNRLAKQVEERKAKSEATDIAVPENGKLVQ